MKLVRCNRCEDIFNLRLEEKTCSCGETKGRYIDNEYAVVAGDHTALAIGNGSYMTACGAASKETSDWRYDGRRDKAIALFEQLREVVPSAFLGWARMPDGPTNSHTKRR